MKLHLEEAGLPGFKALRCSRGLQGLGLRI